MRKVLKVALLLLGLDNFLTACNVAVLVVTFFPFDKHLSFALVFTFREWFQVQTCLNLFIISLCYGFHIPGMVSSSDMSKLVSYVT